MTGYINDIEFEFDNDLSDATPEVQQSIWSLLQLADKEFIPALSSRQGPKDIALNHGSADIDLQPIEYFREMSEQPILIARLKGAVMGFMSFRVDYEVPEIAETVAAYVSTIVIDPVARGRKITTRLYQHLFDMLKDDAGKRSASVATRTWSTNYSHLAILQRLGFQNVYCKKDGRGEGIDTVVYKLQIDKP